MFSILKMQCNPYDSVFVVVVSCFEIKSIRYQPHYSCSRSQAQAQNLSHTFIIYCFYCFSCNCHNKSWRNTLTLTYKKSHAYINIHIHTCMPMIIVIPLYAFSVTSFSFFPKFVRSFQVRSPSSLAKTHTTQSKHHTDTHIRPRGKHKLSHTYLQSFIYERWNTRPNKGKPD